MNLSVLTSFLNDLTASNVFLVDPPLMNALILLKNVCNIEIISDDAVTFTMDGTTKYVTTKQKYYECMSLLYEEGCAIGEALTIMSVFPPYQNNPYFREDWRKAAILSVLGFSFEEEEKEEEEPSYW